MKTVNLQVEWGKSNRQESHSAENPVGLIFDHIHCLFKTASF